VSAPPRKYHRRVPTERERIAALRDLEEAERVRQLGGIVVHDLNNALFALSGRLQLMKRRAADPVAAKQVEELLEAARLFESQLARLHQACRREESNEGPSVARAAVLRGLREALALAGDTDVTVDGAPFDGSGTEPRLALPQDLSFDGDASQIATALRQLLAMHRARAAGAISVRTACEGSDDELRVTVRIEDDAGPWTAPLEAPSLLRESFDLATLPLAAAHRAVRDFGGKVALEQTSIGLRSTLSFEARRGLPLADEAPACDHHAAAAPSARKVLIADDDAAVRAILVAALESIGDDVDTLDDPSAIDGRADLGEFDVAILDAGGGGLEALRRLRARGVEVPVLLASGDLVRFDGCRFTRVTMKPFALDALDRELTALAALRPIDRR